MKEDFTEYDIKPESFLNYLRYYGQHFNKKLCEFACSNLQKAVYTKDKVDSLFKSYNIDIKDSKLYDCVYIANWARSTFYGTSIVDEKHLALFIKDVLEKEGDLVFNRWYVDTAKQGIPIEWEDMI